MGVNLNCVRWTPERLAKARKLAALKLTAREIAAQMGVSRNAVIGANDRHGISLMSKRDAERIAGERRRQHQAAE